MAFSQHPSCGFRPDLPTVLNRHPTQRQHGAPHPVVLLSTTMARKKPTELHLSRIHRGDRRTTTGLGDSRPYSRRGVTGSAPLWLPDPVSSSTGAKSRSLSSSSSLQSSVPSTSAGLTSIEAGAVVWMERMYSRSLAIKCPFFRRRAADLLDGMDMVLRFLVIRHKSLDIVGPPPSWRAPDASGAKRRDLPAQEVLEILRQDWRPESNKGYYVTGRLNATVYRDDCLFDGPDPDMPVQGLRKYLNAASQLFDQSKSRCELLSLEALDEDGKTLLARWRMNGVLRLPWRPVLPMWTGTTCYHRDDQGLIYRHEETWDMSVFQAFMLTFLPSFSRRLGLVPSGAGAEPSPGSDSL